MAEAEFKFRTPYHDPHAVDQQAFPACSYPAGITEFSQHLENTNLPTLSEPRVFPGSPV